MTAVCVVQARMNSTRFPGKVAQLIYDRPALAHVLTRCQTIPGISEVVCAVADTAGSEILIDIAKGTGALVFVGSEADPLSRTLGAARAAGCVAMDDVVMRVTSDCPMIDPAVCGLVLDLARKAVEKRGAYYVSNVHPRTFPKGLDCEVFSFLSLMAANGDATSSYDREHTTPWIARTADHRLNLAHMIDYSKMNWTLDHPSDLAFMRALAEAGRGLPMGLAATIAVLAVNPGLADTKREWDHQDWDGLGR